MKKNKIHRLKILKNAQKLLFSLKKNDMDTVKEERKCFVKI